MVDLKGCDTSTFTRESVTEFFEKLCAEIEMELCEIHFWDDEGVPEDERQTHPDLKGTSALCFIMTSSIVIHTLDLRREAYINLFSCKSFNHLDAHLFIQSWFGGEAIETPQLINRG